VFFKIYDYIISTFHSNKSCFKLFRKVSIMQFLIFFRDIFFRCELNNNAVKRNRPTISTSIKRKHFILFLWFIYSTISLLSNFVKNCHRNLFSWEKKIKKDTSRNRISLCYCKKDNCHGYRFWCL